MSNSNETKAFCYLEQVNDEKNKVALTDTSLLINYRNKHESFELIQVKDLSFGHRKAMLYLIAGGIAVPFTAVAFYRNFLAPWPTLFLLFGGVFAIYLGWRGYQVLTIHLFGFDRDYKLNNVSDNLQAFVKFAVRYLPINQSLGSDAERMIYHITDYTTWRDKRSGTHFRGNQADGFLHASNFDQLNSTLKKHFTGRSNLLLLTIDPFIVVPEIRYQDLKHEGELFPNIYGDLNLDAIIKVEPIN